MGEDIYVGTNLDASSIRERIRKLLKEFEISLSDFEVYFGEHLVLRSSSSVDSTDQNAEAPKSSSSARGHVQEGSE